MNDQLPVPSQTEKQRRPLPWLGIIFLVPALVGLVLLATLLVPLIFSANFAHPELPVVANSPFSESPSGPASVKGGSPVAVLTANSPRIKDSPSKGAFWIDASDEAVADYLLSVMSEEEILGQLFMFGWPKEEASGTILQWIGERNLGGVKVFGWNGQKADVLAKNLGSMQDRALATRQGIPLLTATDQEGGMVRHIKDTTSTSPGNMALGADGRPWDSYETSLIIARELRAIGVNMNFAPTVDVYINLAATVIGSRSYGSNPYEVGLLSIAGLRGMREAGVIATAKHFPGHGNARGDSHGMLPVLSESLETIWNRDLVPYRMLIPEGLPAILVGHLAFPTIAGNEIPASLNPKLNRDLLRDKMGFTGIVITDDMFMGGASSYAVKDGLGMSDLVVQALRAGNDIVMMSRTPEFGDPLWSKVTSAYRNDATFREDVRASVHRILMVKLAYLKPSFRVPLKPDPQKVYDEVPQPDAKRFFRDQAARAVTIIRPGQIPVKPASAGRVALIGQDGDFLREGEKVFPGAESLFYGYEPSAHAAPAILQQARVLAARSDTVIACLANGSSTELIRELEPWAAKVIVISTLSPLFLEKIGWEQTAIAVYGQDAESFRFAFQALIGNFVPDGKLPVGLPR